MADPGQLAPVSNVLPVAGSRTRMSAPESKLRAIVVDDEAFIRQVLTRMLEQLGLDVVAVAENGEPVLELYAEHLPDLVVMDIAMTRTDGLTSLGRLREAYPAACVIICTSFSSQQYIEQAERLGAAGILNKPFDRARIRAKLEGIFPGRFAAPGP